MVHFALSGSLLAYLVVSPADANSPYGLFTVIVEVALAVLTFPLGWLAVLFMSYDIDDSQLVVTVKSITPIFLVLANSYLVTGILQKWSRRRRREQHVLL